MIAVAITAVTIVILDRSGGSRASGGGGGSGGQTVDYVQFQADVQLLGRAGLNAIDPQLSTPDYTPEPRDCGQAAADVGQLQADSRTWPRVLSDPMSKAEDAFSAAASDCSNGDFTTLQTDFGKGQDFLSATKDAFTAHCTPSADEATKWQC